MLPLDRRERGSRRGKVSRDRGREDDRLTPVDLDLRLVQKRVQVPRRSNRVLCAFFRRAFAADFGPS